METKSIIAQNIEIVNVTYLLAVIHFFVVVEFSATVDISITSLPGNISSYFQVIGILSDCPIEVIG